MHVTDEQIKEILRQTQVRPDTGLQLEEAVMDKIEAITPPQKRIQPLRRKARIGAWVSIGLIGCFIISVLFRFITLEPSFAEDISAILLSAMMVAVLVALQLFLGYLTSPAHNLRIGPNLPTVSKRSA